MIKNIFKIQIFILVISIISFTAIIVSISKGKIDSSDDDNIFVNDINTEYILPIEKGYYTSPYGNRLLNNNWNLHYGMDIAGKKDAKVLAFASGTVAKVGYGPSAGNYVQLYHTFSNGDKYTTRYLHFKYEVNLEVGEYVNVGDVLGIQGNTGYSFGDHLHFEISVGHNYSFSKHIANTFDPNDIFNLEIGKYFSFEYTRIKEEEIIELETEWLDGFWTNQRKKF